MARTRIPAQMVTIYEKGGLSMLQISKLLGCSLSSVHRELARLGVASKPVGRPRKKKTVTGEN